jgi:NADPH2:quinone reductase
MMRALVSSADGPQLVDIAQPVPGAGQVLVRVRAAPLNRADLAMLKGAAHGAIGGMGLPLGLEWVGEIEAMGEGVTGWKIGDRVMGSGGGAFAEYTLGHAAMILPVPSKLDFAEAATMPVAILTMYDAIATNGALQAGQSILIQGASSGVGLMGLRIAKQLGAELVIGTSTSPDKRAKLGEFGADIMLDSNDSGWVDQVLKATDGKGVDVVIDMLAGPLFNQTMSATRIGGRIVNVGRMAGDNSSVNFDLHSMRRINYIGVTFRTRNGREIAELIARAKADLGTAIAEGKLTLPVDSLFSINNASAAFAAMATNRHFGKIVLTFD